MRGNLGGCFLATHPGTTALPARAHLEEIRNAEIPLWSPRQGGGTGRDELGRFRVLSCRAWYVGNRHNALEVRVGRMTIVLHDHSRASPREPERRSGASTSTAAGVICAGLDGATRAGTAGVFGAVPVGCTAGARRETRAGAVGCGTGGGIISSSARV
eukprot:scaffold5562_cov116-Isochrysis_galbana.AAC.2